MKIISLEHQLLLKPNLIIHFDQKNSEKPYAITTDNSKEQFWEIIIREDINRFRIPNYPAKKCFCKENSVIKFSYNHPRFYSGCHTFEYGNPMAYVPESITFIFLNVNHYFKEK